MNNLTKKLLHLAFSTAAAFLIAFAVSRYELNTLNELIEISYARSWCDGFFVAGVLYLGAGGLIFIAQNGGFDALRFAFIKLVDKIKHPVNYDANDSQSYYDYVTERHKEPKKSYFDLLAVGTVFIICSIIISFSC